MFIENQKETYQKALNLWGKQVQIDKAVEKFPQLIVAISNYKNGTISLKHCISELCDAVIMTRHLSLIVDETVEFESYSFSVDFDIENVRKIDSDIIVEILNRISAYHYLTEKHILPSDFETDTLKFDLEFQLCKLDFSICEVGIRLDRHLFDKTLRISIKKLDTKISTQNDKQVLANA